MIDYNDNIKVLVLGIGNILLGDEGVGIHVVRELEKCSLPSGVECLDGGTGAFTLLDPMERSERIIMIDAALNKGPVGTLTRLVPKFASDYPVSLSCHEVGLRDLLNSFYLLGKESPNIILYAISIEPPVGGFRLNLTKEIKELVPIVVSQIQEEINDYFKLKKP